MAKNWIQYRILPEHGQTLFTCEDCGQNYPLYLVRDEVWEMSGRIGWNSGNLCQSCLGKTIGRKILKSDLLLYPLKVNPEGRGLYKAHFDYFVRVKFGRR